VKRVFAGVLYPCKGGTTFSPVREREIEKERKKEREREREKESPIIISSRV
jgi:hypothetical protein